MTLVANQPATRLHSQLDFGGHSAAAKHRGREVARMHPDDAAARGISDGDIIRLFNARGACLAGVRITDGIRRGVIQLPTGAWYDPADPEEDNPLCVHGNPERADPRRRHIGVGAGLHRPAHDRRGRALRRQPAADPGLRSAVGGDSRRQGQVMRGLVRVTFAEVGGSVPVGAVDFDRDCQ